MPRFALLVLFLVSLLVLSAAQNPSSSSSPSSSYLDHAHKKEDSREEHEWPGFHGREKRKFLRTCVIARRALLLQNCTSNKTGLVPAAA